MTPEERAKQFMPFAAVRGLDEALARKEQALLRIERPEWPEEQAAALNARLTALRCGDTVALTYYADGFLHALSGTLKAVDTVQGTLTVDDTVLPIGDVTAVAGPEEHP